MNIFCFTVVFVFCVLYVARLWQRRWLYYHAAKLEGPRAWPLLGNALFFVGRGNVLDKILLLFKTYKSPVRIWFGGKLIIGVAKSQDLQVVMKKALSKEETYRFVAPIAGTGLFSAPVDKWRRHRKVILPTFNQKILNNFVEMFAKRAEDLVEKFQNYSGKGPVDIFDDVSVCSLNLLCDTALGREETDQSQNLIYVQWVKRAMQIVYTRIFRIWLHNDFLWKLTSHSAELHEISAKLKKFLRKIIVERKEKYSEDKRFFLSLLIELSETERWTEEEIMEEVATVTIAGSDTTAITISFTFLMLGIHQNIQAKVFEEISVIFGNNQRRVTSEDISKMDYLERVIKETMRLFPAGPLISRYLDQDIKLESCTLPKGSSCVFGIIYTHRDPELWPEPLRFDPDRFLPDEVAKRHPYCYVPFSGGPRNCIGIKYAMKAMKTVISTVLRKFRITTEYKSVGDIKLSADVMIKSVNGYKIALGCRDDRSCMEGEKYNFKPDLAQARGGLSNSGSKLPTF